MVERINSCQDLAFTCLSCGEKLDTRTRTEDHGNCESGNCYVEVEYYTKQDAYFMRLENCTIFGDLFGKVIYDSIEEEKSKLKADVEKQVPTDEFREIILASKYADVGLKFTKNLENLTDIVLGLNLQKWEDQFFKIKKYGHAIHYDCAKPLFEKQLKIEEIKYVIDKGNKKLLNAKITTDSKTFLDVLKFFSKYISEHVGQPYIEDSKQLNFEIAHFSEYF